MISFLQGKPLLTGTTLTVVVSGVGYEVHASPATISKLASLPEVSLHIYTHVREDQLTLYGFESYQDRALFLLVLGVSGVGPATALTIVSAGSAAVITAVQQAQVTFFSNLPRIGKKLAQKIIIELGSKLGEMKKLELGPQSQVAQDLTETLVGMGFNEAIVLETLNNLDVEELGLEKALNLALKKLGTQKTV
jgi:holliday junction DNA helicase RuvA